MLIVQQPVADSILGTTFLCKKVATKRQRSANCIWSQCGETRGCYYSWNNIPMQKSCDKTPTKCELYLVAMWRSPQLFLLLEQFSSEDKLRKTPKKCELYLVAMWRNPWLLLFLEQHTTKESCDKTPTECVFVWSQSGENKC